MMQKGIKAVREGIPRAALFMPGLGEELIIAPKLHVNCYQNGA
jgi:hypothetical protein